MPHFDCKQDIPEPVRRAAKALRPYIKDLDACRPVRSEIEGNEEAIQQLETDLSDYREFYGYIKQSGNHPLFNGTGFSLQGPVVGAPPKPIGVNEK